MRTMTHFMLPVLCAVFLTAPVGAARADALSDFYHGKTMKLIIGAGAGGGNDAYSRLLARHMGGHVPGHPAIVAQNLPGAGGQIAASFLYAKAPKDGTVFGMVTRVVPMDPLISKVRAPFEALKLNWLGSLDKATNIVIAWYKTPIRTFEDTFKQEMVVAAAGASTDGVVYPRLMNRLLGTKFKIVAGYPGSAQMMLAMERGEVQGRGGLPYSTLLGQHVQWLKEKKVRILVQLALKKDRALPNVPLLFEYIKDPETKRIFSLLFSRQEMGRPFVAPPDLPADRLKALRAAFMETATGDSGFLADAKRSRLTLDVIDGDEVTALIREAYATPKPTLEKIKALLSEKGGLAKCSDVTDPKLCVKKKKKKKKKKG